MGLVSKQTKARPCQARTLAKKEPSFIQISFHTSFYNSLICVCFRIMIFLSNFCKSRTFSPIETKENKTKVINFLKTVRIWQFRRIFFPFNVWRTQKFLAYLAYPPVLCTPAGEVLGQQQHDAKIRVSSRSNNQGRRAQNNKKEDKNIM